MLNRLVALKLSDAEMDSIVSDKLDWILKFADPEEVWLFGSAARREMTSSSDVDLMLVFADQSILEKGRNRLNQNRKAEVSGWPQDLIYYTRDSWRESLSSGGGAAWLATREGKRLFSRLEVRS